MSGKHVFSCILSSDLIKYFSDIFACFAAACFHFHQSWNTLCGRDTDFVLKSVKSEVGLMHPELMLGFIV